MSEVTRVEPIYDADGWETTGGYSRWDCEKCKAEVRRYRGQRDVSCNCGAQYNSCGQRLRDDWRGNRSNYDSNVGDMEGYEMQHAGDN